MFGEKPLKLSDSDEKLLQTAEEAVFQIFDMAGVETIPIAPSEITYARDASTGWGQHYRTKGEYVDAGELDNNLPEFMKGWSKEHYVPLWTVKGKQEYLPTHKIDDKNVRVFIIPNVDVYFTQAMYSQRFNHLMTEKLDNWCAVGSAFQHGGFNKLYHRLAEYPLIVEGDCEKWDKSVRERFLRASELLRRRLYKGRVTKEYNEWCKAHGVKFNPHEMLRAIYDDVCNAFFVLPDGLVLKTLYGVMPSGFGNTTYDNCIYHALILTAMIIEFKRRTDPTWFDISYLQKAVLALLYADDHLLGFHTDLRPILSFEYRAAFYARFGFRLKKADDKVSDDPINHKFLGATPVMIHGDYYPVYNIDKVKASLVRVKEQTTKDIAYVRALAYFILICASGDPFVDVLRKYMSHLVDERLWKMLKNQDIILNADGFNNLRFSLHFSMIPTVQEGLRFWSGNESSPLTLVSDRVEKGATLEHLLLFLDPDTKISLGQVLSIPKQSIKMNQSGKMSPMIQQQQQITIIKPSPPITQPSVRLDGARTHEKMFCGEAELPTYTLEDLLLAQQKYEVTFDLVPTFLHQKNEPNMNVYVWSDGVYTTVTTDYGQFVHALVGSNPTQTAMMIGFTYIGAATDEEIAEYVSFEKHSKPEGSKYLILPTMAFDPIERYAGKTMLEFYRGKLHGAPIKRAHVSPPGTYNQNGPAEAVIKLTAGEGKEKPKREKEKKPKRGKKTSGVQMPANRALTELKSLEKKVNSLAVAPKRQQLPNQLAVDPSRVAALVATMAMPLNVKSPMRYCGGMSNQETVIAKLVDRINISQGTTNRNSGIPIGDNYVMVFRDVLRNYIYFDPNTTDQTYLYKWEFVNRQPDGNISQTMDTRQWQYIELVQGQQSFQNFMWASSGAPYSPHGPKLYGGCSNDRGNDRYVWCEPNSIINCYNETYNPNTTCSFYMGPIMLVEGEKPETGIEIKQDLTQFTNYTGMVTIPVPVRGYYNVSFVTNNTALNSPKMKWYIENQGGGGVWCHRTIPQYNDNRPITNGIRMNGVCLEWKNTTSVLNSQAMACMAQVPAGTYPFEPIMDGNGNTIMGYADVACFDQSNPMKRGAYGYLKPTQPTDFDMIENIAINKRLKGTPCFVINPKSDFLIYYFNGFGSANAVTGTLFVGSTIEYRSTSIWRPGKTPVGNASEWAEAILEIGRAQQFSENPGHYMIFKALLGSIARWAPQVGKKIGQFAEFVDQNT